MPVDLPKRVRSDPLLVSSIQVGTATGVAGLAFGAAYGSFKLAHPGVFAVTASITSFFYGAGAFYTRGVILAYQGQERTRRSELLASGGGGMISGALTGAVFNRNVYSALRSGTLSAILALSCQAAYHTVISPTRQSQPQTSFIDRIAAKLPFRAIPDSEYEEILKLQLSQIDNEIESLDERIGNLRRQTSSLQDTEP